ncbi:hypothetical protein ACF0H5_022262 [Mactra antiquata]
METTDDKEKEVTNNNNNNDDDRWEVFNNPSSDLQKLGVKKQKPKLPNFNACLTRVIVQKSQRKRQEYICKTATNLAKSIIDIAHVLDPNWGEFTTTNKNGVITAPIRTLSEDKYEVMVPLKRPIRLDGFKVYQRGKDEMPQHRCLIQLNDDLCVQEVHLVRREWEKLVNKEGYLRPKSVLDWFNKGLNKARLVLLSDNHNVDRLVCSVGDDGTANLEATVTDFDGDELAICVFNVNIYPVFVLDRLPPSLKLNAPLPCFGPYIQGQKEFRKLVLEDMANGKQVAFLDPKYDNTHTKIKRSLPQGGPTWRINLSFTEYHVYSLIDKYCRGLNFRHVLVLLNIFKDEFQDELSILNNDILVNTLFNVSQKHIDNIRDKKEWIFKVMQTLSDGLQQGFLPSFHLPRLNLLDVYGITEKQSKVTSQALKIILESIQKKPSNLYKFVGHLESYVPKSKKDQPDGTEDCNTNTEADTDNLLAVNDPRDVNNTPSVMDAARGTTPRHPRVRPEEDDEGDVGDEGHEEEHNDIIHDLERARLRKSAERRVVFEDDSGITKPSKVGNRSDIY